MKSIGTISNQPQLDPVPENSSLPPRVISKTEFDKEIVTTPTSPARNQLKILVEIHIANDDNLTESSFLEDLLNITTPLHQETTLFSSMDYLEGTRANTPSPQTTI